MSPSDSDQSVIDADQPEIAHGVSAPKSDGPVCPTDNQHRAAPATDDALRAFEAMRPRLFGIAYRMLGSVADAEDIVQDAWLRWHAIDLRDIRDPEALLVTIAVRLSLNNATSARSRRETYIGPWLPEPVLTEEDPLLGAERTDALRIGMLVLLERLSPLERAVFVLHEAFGYRYVEIGDLLGIAPGTARQHAFRARRRITDEPAAAEPSPDEDRLLAAFLRAARTGDLEALQQVLTDDVVLVSDGGGIVSAARRPVRGRANVARFLAGLAEKLFDGADDTLVSANAQQAFMLRRGAVPHLLGALDVTRDGITMLYLVMNPDKLSQLAPLPPAETDTTRPERGESAPL